MNHFMDTCVPHVHSYRSSYHIRSLVSLHPQRQFLPATVPQCHSPTASVRSRHRGSIPPIHPLRHLHLHLHLFPAPLEGSRESRGNKNALRSTRHRSHRRPPSSPAPPARQRRSTGSPTPFHPSPLQRLPPCACMGESRRLRFLSPVATDADAAAGTTGPYAGQWAFMAATAFRPRPASAGSASLIFFSSQPWCSPSTTSPLPSVHRHCLGSCPSSQSGSGVQSRWGCRGLLDWVRF